MRNRALLTDLDHLPDSSYRQELIPRARLIVEACVQDAAVVAALMAADRSLLFQHRNARARHALGDPISRRKPDDASAYDDDTLTHSDSAVASSGETGGYLR